MADILNYIASFVFVLALIGLGAWVLRRFVIDGGGASGALFQRVRNSRLGIVETASIDARRKLILLRRDNVEHLIMIGGPSDIIVETGITQSGDRLSSTSGTRLFNKEETETSAEAREKTA